MSEAVVKEGRLREMNANRKREERREAMENVYEVVVVASYDVFHPSTKLGHQNFNQEVANYTAKTSFVTIFVKLKTTHQIRWELAT